jgi:hypothetical protein
VVNILNNNPFKLSVERGFLEINPFTLVKLSKAILGKSVSKKWRTGKHSDSAVPAWVNLRGSGRSGLSDQFRRLIEKGGIADHATKLKTQKTRSFV